MKRSAGLLLYRRGGRGLEVFLVHPGGPFWSRRDDGAWTIPKGELDVGEDPLAGARREFLEETGAAPDGVFTPLAPIRQRGGKVVDAWVIEGDLDPLHIVSSTFTVEWPPRSGMYREFPEVDRAAWFDICGARVKLLEAQRPFLDQLTRMIEGDRAPAASNRPA